MMTLMGYSVFIEREPGNWFFFIMNGGATWTKRDMKWIKTIVLDMMKDSGLPFMQLKS